MDKPYKFEMVDDIAISRLAAQVSWEQATQLLQSVVVSAHQQNIRKLMLVTLGLTGFEPPSIPARYLFMEKLVKIIGWDIRVAFVSRSEMIDARNFGAAAALNDGVITDIFKTEKEALVWLQK